MPEATAAYLASATLTAGSTLTYAQIAYATYAAYTVAVVAGLSAQQRRAERKARDAARSALTGRNFTTKGTIEPRQLVMGQVRTGGVEAFIGSTGAQKEKLTVVIAVASHRISNISAVYFGEELLTLDGSGNVTGGSYSKTTVEDATAAITITAGNGSVALPSAPTGAVRVVVPPGTAESSEGFFTGSVSGSVVTFTGVQQEAVPYTGAAVVQYQVTRVTARARLRWVLGTDDQAAFADLITQFPGQWTADHRGRGVAYLVAELDFDPDVYPNGPPRISVVPQGADQVFDPRTGLTGYSQNPALLMRWYLLHPLGGRRKPHQIDEASFIAAANVCDQVVDYGDGPRPRFTAAYVASTEQVPAAVCDDLAEAMAGSWGYAGGVIRVRAGAVSAAVADIDETWLAEGQMQIQPAQPRSQIGNVMQGTFVDPAKRWQQEPFPRVPQGAEAAALVAEDGGIERAQDLELAAVTHIGQAQHIAAVKLREQRQGMRISLDCNLKAYALQMFDVVRLTFPRYLGSTPKLFELERRTFTMTGGIRLVLRETGSALYEIGASVPAGDFLPNTSLPNPRIVPTVGAVTASSGPTVLPDGSVVSRVVLSWPAINDRNVTDGGFVEVGYREASDTSGLRTTRADSFTGHTLVGLRGGRGYVFMARAVNGLGVRGQWSAATAHVVYLVRGPRNFVQDSEPTGDVRDNDTWTDTNDGKHPYLRVGGAWVSVRDETIATAQAAATAAAGAASAAQTSANAANSALADIASDSVLTPDEKPRVILDRDVIVAERSGIEAQADNYAVTTEKAAYSSAVDALVAYLATLTSPVLWSNLTGNTTIVGATFRATFAEVYTKRQALLDKINANAKARLGALATLNAVGTGQIEAEAATTVVRAYAAGPFETATNICAREIVAPVNCKVIVTATATRSCTNATGSTKLRHSSFAVFAFGVIGGVSLGGGSYSPRFHRAEIADGQFERDSISTRHVFEGVLAGDEFTVSVAVSETTLATIVEQFTDVTLEIEVIKR